MGLLIKLTTQGSPLSAANGGSISVNPLATPQSKLHADGSQEGYSIAGTNASTVSAQYQQYNDGVTNAIPQPSQLDLGTSTPNQYINNLPQ